MSIQRSYTLVLASLSQTTVRPTALQCWTSKPLPRKARRYLATDGPSGNDSSKLSSPTAATAAKEDASPGKKSGFEELDSSFPIVEFDTLRGRTRRNVRVSGRTNAETLTAAMSPLLTAHLSNLNSTGSVGSKWWHLGSEGGVIIRFFAFESEADATKFVASVRTTADEMDHHPHIATSSAQTQEITHVRYVGISCSTHRPPGLSMRDIRLARKINELAEPFNYMASNTDITSRFFLKAIRKSLARELDNQRAGK